MPPSQVIGLDARTVETGLSLPLRITSAAPTRGSNATGPGNASELATTAPVIVMHTTPSADVNQAMRCGKKRERGTNARSAPSESSQARENVE